MRPGDPRSQAEIDADIAQLRAELISVINPDLAYRLRGMARVLNSSPAAVFNRLLYDVQPLLALADAALAFTAHPTEETVTALTAAADEMRTVHHHEGHPEVAGVRAVQALGTLHGA